MPLHFLSITERPEEAALAKVLAQANQTVFHQANTAQKVREILKENPQTLVFWDVDHADAVSPGHPMSFQVIGQLLGKMLPPERIFAISGGPLSETPYVYNMPVFGHHILRNFQNPAAKIYYRVTRACLMEDPFGLAKYMPDNTPVQKLTLKRSKERPAATEAVNNIFLKKGIPPQLATLAAQAVDEMLMNAIFDAPSSGGKAYQRERQRNADFELSDRENVDLEIGSTSEYIAVSVGDNFGSLKKETVLGYIRKDYEKREYKVKEDDPGAGLGVYGVLKNGLSLLFISKPNHRTEVVLFFPVVKSMKSFRNSFRFFSFIIK